MNKGQKKERWQFLPKYAIIPLITVFVFNSLVYSGTGAITSSWRHYDLTLGFDRAVPLVPAFITIYFICYIFWIINYILTAGIGKEYCMRFITAELMAKLVCGVIFLALPTTNVRPEILGNDIWSEILKILYKIDAPANLFPSIHCLVSWFSFIGIRGRKEIPKAYRVFSCVFALLVCASTQFIKQHYIVDAIAGIGLAEFTYYIAFHTNLYKGPGNIFERISKGVWKE